ncbi:MAG: hypothetical protein ACOC93_02980, partial [Planctomycetota bacterium]
MSRHLQIALSLLIVTLGLVGCDHGNGPAPDGARHLAGSTAVERGTAFLQQRQRADGYWPPHQPQFPGGATALAT